MKEDCKLLFSGKKDLDAAAFVNNGTKKCKL